MVKFTRNENHSHLDAGMEIANSKNRARCHGARIVPGCQKTTLGKTPRRKNLTPMPKLWYNFGAPKSNTFVCRIF